MSSTVIKEFLVSLGFDVKENELNKFSGGIAQASVKAAALGAAVVSAAGAVTAFVSKVADELDQLGELADRTETAAVEIDKLGYIATMTDSSVQAVNTSLESLNKNAGDAATGVGRAKQIFEKIGVSVRDSNGKLKNSADLMKEVGAAISGMDKGQQMAIMERLGIDRTLLKSITGDVAALGAEYDAMMEAAGFSMEEATSAASDFMDAQGKLRMTFDKLRQSVAVKFMRGLAKAFDAFRKMMIDNMPIIVRTITPIIAAVMKAAEIFLFLANTVMQVVGFIVGGLLKLNDATNGWAGYIMAAIVAWKLLNATFLATPLGMILSLAAAIALLVEDFMVWQEGGESLIPWEKWVEQIDAAKAAISAFGNWLQPYSDMVFSIFDKLQNLGSFIGQNLPVLTPSPATQASASGGANVNQQTVINVNGGDPQATARAVAGEQNGVNDNMVRNMKGAVR